MIDAWGKGMQQHTVAQKMLRKYCFFYLCGFLISVFFRKMYRALSYKLMCLNLLTSLIKYVSILLPHFQSYTRNLQSFCEQLTIQIPKHWFSVWENTRIQALSVTYWPLCFPVTKGRMFSVLLFLHSQSNHLCQHTEDVKSVHLTVHPNVNSCSLQ